MREVNKIAESLFEKIRDRYEDVSLGDENAKATNDPEKARFFNFDYLVDGENHGNITMSLIDETSLKVYFSKNITDGLTEHEKKHWYQFLRELREFAKRNLLSFEPRDITRSTLKHRDIAQQSKADSTYNKDEVIGESKLYGTSKSSYQKFGPARIIVRHNAPVVDEMTGARSRHINSIYVENAEGERFKMPFKSLTGARAMARHVSAGGTPHDDLGSHICEMAVECSKLKPFMNSVRRRTFEDQETQAMVESAFEYHGLLNNTLKRMSGKKGYTHCKEQFESSNSSYLPEDEANLDEMKERFIKRVFNDKMTDALPLVHKAYKMKKENKFAQQFESWANTVAEGWDEDEEGVKQWGIEPINADDLIEALSDEIPVGVDAVNAINAIGDIIQNDELKAKLVELANADPTADARDTIMDWLQDNVPAVFQEVVDEIGDQDTPEPSETGSEGGDLDESDEELYVACIVDYDRSGQAKVLRSKPVSKERAEEIIAGARAKDKFTKPLFKTIYPASAGKLDAESIMKQFPNLAESVASDAADECAEPGQFSKTYGSGDGGMDGTVYEEHDYCDACDRTADKCICEDEDEDDNSIDAIATAIIRRILTGCGQGDERMLALLRKLGPEGIVNAAVDIAEFAGPVHEIGSSDVSGWVAQLERDAGLGHHELEEAFDRALGEGQGPYELYNPKHPKFKANYEKYKAKHPDCTLAEFIAAMKKREHGTVEENFGDVMTAKQKSEKLKRMGAKDLSTLDKLKIMPSQAKAMAKGDSEDDLLHYNKQFKEDIDQMLRIAGLK